MDIHDSFSCEANASWKRAHRYKRQKKSRFNEESLRRAFILLFLLRSQYYYNYDRASFYCGRLTLFFGSTFRVWEHKLD